LVEIHTHGIKREAISLQNLSGSSASINQSTSTNLQL